MFVIPTRSKFKSETNPNSPKAISHSGKSRAELQVLGERMGYQDRELSAKDVANLGADEYLWFTCFFPQRISDAEQIESNKRNNQTVKKTMDVRRMWRNASEDESASARSAGEEFAARYPAFVRHTENALAIARYMETHDLDATRVESYAEAFTDLAMQGLITLSPRDAGVGPEARLSGNELKSYPKLHLLLQPSRVLKPEDKLSADEYFTQHPELQDTRTPPLVAARNAKRAATEEFLKQSESATTRSGSTSVTDYKLGKE